MSNVKESVEMAVPDNTTIEAIKESSIAYCSMVANTKEEKIALYNATSNPEARLGEMIGEEINVVHLIFEMITVKNDEGFEDEAPRIILIDDDGKSYTAVSWGIYNSLKNVFRYIGNPPFNPPLKIKVTQVIKGTKRTLQLRVIG